MKRSWQERLWEKVTFPEGQMGCWVWEGAMTSVDDERARHFGKPVMMLDHRGEQGKPQRLLYERFWPLEPYVILHSSCGNQRCVNPLHATVSMQGSARVARYMPTHPLHAEVAARWRQPVSMLWRHGASVRSIASMTQLSPFNVARLLREDEPDD